VRLSNKLRDRGKRQDPALSKRFATYEDTYEISRQRLECGVCHRFLASQFSRYPARLPALYVAHGRRWFLPGER